MKYPFLSGFAAFTLMTLSAFAETTPSKNSDIIGDGFEKSATWASSNPEGCAVYIPVGTETKAKTDKLIDFVKDSAKKENIEVSIISEPSKLLETEIIVMCDEYLRSFLPDSAFVEDLPHFFSAQSFENELLKRSEN